MTDVSQELELSHRYAALREDIFDAWINPAVLTRWSAAQPSWQTPVAEVDATEGGSYRLSTRTDTGDVTDSRARRFVACTSTDGKRFSRISSGRSSQG